VHFKERGQDYVFAKELCFELFHLACIGLGGALAFLAIARLFKCSRSILEKLFKPIVNLIGIALMLVATIGDRRLPLQMPFENGHYFLMR
jgi:hypothetical protein